MNLFKSDRVIYEKFGNIHNMMYLLGEKNFRNGFPYCNQNYRKRSLLFNPIIKNLFYVFVLTKDFISDYKTDQNYAVFMGDWFHDTSFKFHQFIFKFQMTLSLIIPVYMNVSVDIINYFFIKDNECLKSFINNEYNERIPTAIKMKHIFRSIERLFTYSLYLFGFCI